MKYHILALLATAPAHGYELKQAIDELFGAIQPPMNAGQIYTTLSRLERDGFVEPLEVVEQEDRPTKKVYQLTPSGHQALYEWWNASVEGPYLKDEFFSKLILARATGIADISDMIDGQRITYMNSLKQLAQLALQCQQEQNQTSLLLIEGAIYHLQADLKWLELCEQRLV